jgi:hypothetical protein
VKLRERDIQSQILDWLALQKIFHYRQNTGSVARAYKGKSRFIRFGKRGAPDIVCVIAGRYVGIEVKREGEEQTEHQKEFEKELRYVGGGYYLCTDSLDDAIGFIGEIRKWD